mgnify:CR=1 FL=1
MSLATIIKISNKYGSKPEFVLAGGGNTSFKDDDFLYIKGSGTTLATIKEAGFVKMNRAKLSAMFDKKYSEDTVSREAEVLEDMTIEDMKLIKAKAKNVVKLKNLDYETYEEYLELNK